MKILEDPLPRGQVPALSIAKSTAVHVWVPKKGWVRQARPNRKEPGLSAGNALIPWSEGRPSKRALSTRLRTLGTAKGVLVVMTTEGLWGLYHDNRGHLYRHLLPLKECPEL